MNLPSIDELEIQLRTGSGIAIFVEGDNDHQDPFYYRRWFDADAGTFTFFPRDGWRHVIQAVDQLRPRLPSMPVFGIIDRDFADADEFAAFNNNFAHSHLLKTPKFTLENYLLDAECWHQTFELISRAPVAGWDSPDAVALQIEKAYDDCLPVSAHNWIIRNANLEYDQSAEYVSHPMALNANVASTKLTEWGSGIDATEDLGTMYQQRLQQLRQMPRDELDKFVSGKLVIQELHRHFPNLRRGQLPLEPYLNIYLDRCPDPHDDLRAVLDKIRAAAQR